VLVVRGLNEQVLEENLHCEFSKHAPIKVMKFLNSVSSGRLVTCKSVHQMWFACATRVTGG
jgi:hypothetical protein